MFVVRRNIFCRTTRLKRRCRGMSQMKKNRHSQKRKKKQAEARRKNSISPLKRLAEAKGEVEYWMSADFETFGQAEIFIFKRGDGLSGFVGFLVDRGIAGLKDAWAQMNVDRAGFASLIKSSEENGVPVKRVTVDEIRRLVLGAIRWASEHGMRLPPQWEKAVRFVGDPKAWATADVSSFKKEFVGHPKDLRQRLIAAPFETFVQRDDIKFVLSDDATYIDQETGEYVDNGDLDLDNLTPEELEKIANDIPLEELDELSNRLRPAAEDLIRQTRAFNAALGVISSPELSAAWEMFVLVSVLSRSAMPGTGQEEYGRFAGDMQETLTEQIDPARRDEFDRAMEQIFAYCQADPQVLQRALAKHAAAIESEPQ